MRIKIIVTMVIVALLGSSQPSFAHARLTSSFPLNNQTINQVPNWVWLEFDGNLMVLGDKNPNQISILDSRSRRVDVGGAVISGARISTKVAADLMNGRYRIKFRVISEDGHPVLGNLYFTLHRGRLPLRSQ